MTRARPRDYLLVAIVAIVTMATLREPAAQDGSYGTAIEAKTMLQNAVEALRRDHRQALRDFTAGTAPFRFKDLYVFCADLDDRISAHGVDPSLIGAELRQFEDSEGKAFGAEILDRAREGELHVVDYLWPRPGDTEPAPKSAYVTRASGQTCAVGWYED